MEQEQAQVLQAPAALEKAKAVDSFNKLYEKGKRKKVNPSKSRQGRAIQVNGALRNPFWTMPNISARVRNPGGRKHPRTLWSQAIDNLKAEARTAIEAHNDYAAKLFQEMNDYHINLGEVDWHLDRRMTHHLDTFLLKAGRIRRRLERQVSRELDLRWTVDTVEGDEVITISNLV